MAWDVTHRVVSQLYLSFQLRKVKSMKFNQLIHSFTFCINYFLTKAALLVEIINHDCFTKNSGLRGQCILAIELPNKSQNQSQSVGLRNPFYYCRSMAPLVQNQSV